MKILAIDPGYDRLGIAVLEGDPSRPILLMSDCLIPTDKAREKRLALVSSTIESVIAEYAPEALAIETLFFNANRSSAIGVAEARGVVIAAAGRAGLALVECSPQQVKIAVTGHGGADKKSVAQMVPKLLSLPGKKRLDDELDAIAVGITGLAMGLPRRH